VVVSVVVGLVIGIVVSVIAAQMSTPFAPSGQRLEVRRTADHGG
jgi:uncharacterized membrane-anchored protein YhcB (DUF1043 family)